MVSLAAASGILDNDIHKELCHQFLSFHFRKTVPGIRVFGIDQIEHTDGIAFVTQVFAGLFV